MSAWFHGYAGHNSYFWDTDLERVAERLSSLEADVNEDLPNSQQALLDFKEEHRQRVTHIQQVKSYLFCLVNHHFLKVESLRRRPLSGKHGLVRSD